MSNSSHVASVPHQNSKRKRTTERTKGQHLGEMGEVAKQVLTASKKRFKLDGSKQKHGAVVNFPEDNTPVHAACWWSDWREQVDPQDYRDFSTKGFGNGFYLLLLFIFYAHVHSSSCFFVFVLVFLFLFCFVCLLLLFFFTTLFHTHSSSCLA